MPELPFPHIAYIPESYHTANGADKVSSAGMFLLSRAVPSEARKIRYSDSGSSAGDMLHFRQFPEVPEFCPKPLHD